VSGLVVVNKQTPEVAITGEPKTVINDLVARFAKVFGTFATDVSKQAVADILIDIPVEDVPNGLK